MGKLVKLGGASITIPCFVTLGSQWFPIGCNLPLLQRRRLADYAALC
jgi:hypothetical protein